MDNHCDPSILRDHEETHAAARRVGRTYLGDGLYGVYTTFLGCNHDVARAGPPLLFETMIRDERSGQWWAEQWRYSTWAEAEAGHQQAIDYAQHKLAGEPVEDAPTPLRDLLKRLFPNAPSH